MKTDRLVSMIFLLMKKKKVSARELADFYDCSIRTIYRDIETLENAGVPIVSYRGTEGGFELIEGYRIEKPFLSSQEASLILGLLQGIQQVVDDVEVESISTKMEGADANFSNLYFDMKGWGMSEDFRDKANRVNQAITQHKAIDIEYYSSYLHCSIRKINPLKIIIKGSQWYLHAFCTRKNDYRLFKISRIKSLQTTDEVFDPSDYKLIPEQNDEWAENTETFLILKFDKKIYSSFKDFFLEENIIENTGEHFIVSVRFPIDHWVKSLILSFGEMVEVIEPAFLRKEIKEAAQKIVDKYDTT
ncbi:MAG: helix-turn-helix transcriptional regulator [Thermotogota bacterium]